MPEADPSGSVTSPRGFRAGSIYAGMKNYGQPRDDVGVLLSDSPCAAAAVYTRNRLHSASIYVNRAHLADGRAQAVVVNAGIANSSTGARGIADGRQATEWVASRFGLAPADVLVCSTGVIGPFLKMDRLQSAIESVELSEDGGHSFSRAIMTTDTRPKSFAVAFDRYVLGGCAKGAGMIHPNMATMLSFITTDAPVAADLLDDALREAVDTSFNAISVDGDTSPSDTVIVMANGAAGGHEIVRGSPGETGFRAALNSLCLALAKEIARDGEGATKLIEIAVENATSREQARRLIHTVATSYLVKTAVYGADPNWGRLVACLGRSEVDFVESAVRVELCGQLVFANEQPVEFDEGALSAAMRGSEVTIRYDLGAGDERLVGWGCDLTEEYVRINAEYTT